MANRSDVTFKAPWGRTLLTITTLVCGLLLGIVLLGIVTGPRDQLIWGLLMVVMPLAILAGSALLTVRRYTLTGKTLKVQRLLWVTIIPLVDLHSARVEPNAMQNSIRVFGNGGLFAFTGRFRNQKLGAYEAFATDLEQTVVLTFPNRKIVLSPDTPDKFVESVLQRRADV
ncbi:MAG: hypothetical protein F6K42_25785 [Leptolyngbya sp. SIO1D8]|nr:hypothetical protein [Leptolyngbya sp. SIO1D8]